MMDYKPPAFSCRTCPSMVPLQENVSHGFCHGVPPTPMENGPENFSSAHPIVTLETGWCDLHPESPRSPSYRRAS